MENKRVQGLIAAVYTPMQRDGELALARIGDMARFLSAQGAVDGVFLCGSTGEGLSLSDEERRRVVEEWMRFSRKDFKIMVHVGHGCLTESVRLAAHAEGCGADSVASIGPLFFKPSSVDGLVDYCHRIADAAPSLPFYYYHVPSVTGIVFPMTLFMEKAMERIPNFQGIKYTDEDLMEFAECLDVAGNDVDVFFGRDEVMLSALAVGATSFIGGTFPFSAALYRRLIDNFKAGRIDLARQAQAQARKMVKVLRCFGGRTAGKVAMRMIGIDCGSVRLPLTALENRDVMSLLAQLAELGIFEAGPDRTEWPNKEEKHLCGKVERLVSRDSTRSTSI